MIWCAEMPAAFIEMTSLFWLRPASVISVPSSTAKGRKRAMSCGMRSADIAPQLGVAIAGIGEDLAADSPSRSSIIRTSTSATSTARLRMTNSRAM